MTGITDDVVAAALRAHDAEPGGDNAERRKMIEALMAARLWDRDAPGPAQAARTDIALGAYRNSYGYERSREAAMRQALQAVAGLITPKPKRAEATAAEVEQAVRAYLDESDYGMFEMIYGTYQNVANLARVDTDLTERASGRAQAWNRFTGQVMRAFNKLADQGVLRKAGAGSTGPDGRTLRRSEVRFYTPETWDAIAAWAAEQRDAAQARRHAWEGLHDRLGALVIPNINPRGAAVVLSLEDWERLLSLAEAGRTKVPELP